MTRPTSIEDLDNYDRKGHVVATIPSSYITRYPSLGQHLLAALAEAERLGLPIVDDGIMIPLTDQEIESKVKRAQDSWDFGKEVHDQYLKDGVWPDRSWAWTAYLRAEGIEAPKKPEVES